MTIAATKEGTVVEVLVPMEQSPDPEPVQAEPQQSSPFWDVLTKVGLALGIIVSIRSLNE
ncbi:MAG: hypothetical protein ABSF12_09625 [Bryobacteraceae bacterium]|jgi:hypothetical protein